MDRDAILEFARRDWSRLDDAKTNSDRAVHDRVAEALRAVHVRSR